MRQAGDGAHLRGGKLASQSSNASVGMADPVFAAASFPSRSESPTASLGLTSAATRAAKSAVPAASRGTASTPRSRQP